MPSSNSNSFGDDEIVATFPRVVKMQCPGYQMDGGTLRG